MKTALINTALIFTILIAGTLLGGCTGVSVQSGLPLGEVGTAAVAGPVLRNNPKYIPIAQKVGPDLVALNYTDLSLTGINSAVALVVNKEGGDADLAAMLEGGIDAGLAAYLGAVAESSLSNDPTAQLVLQALGKGITDGATWAVANPK